LEQGGKRPGAGRPSYSPEFVNWVWYSVRREIDNGVLDAVKRRASNEKGLQRLRKQLSNGSIEEEALKTSELEVAQGWKAGLEGQELLSRLTVELERKIDGVYISVKGLSPTPSEMSAIYKRISQAGQDPKCDVNWTVISPKIVKRAWLQALGQQRELEASLKKER
jgi:hypothetical protein